MTAPPAPSFMHGTVVTVGECGVLIEGPSGSGKSTLAAALLDEAAAHGRLARLVGDDRVSLVACHGRLIARPHPAIAGLLERRGLGLVQVAHEPAAVVCLAVRVANDPAERGPRLPAEVPTLTRCGIALPLVVLLAQDAACDNARRLMAAMRALAGPDWNESNRLANSAAMHNIAPHDAAGGHVAEST